jgi:glycosyltransferase involved in cell wall biosynthesis
MVHFANVELGDNADFTRLLRRVQPDIIVTSYRAQFYDRAFEYRDETGTPVVGVLHGHPEQYRAIRSRLTDADAVILPSAYSFRAFMTWNLPNAVLIPHGVKDFSTVDGITSYNLKDRFDLPVGTTLVGWVGRLQNEKSWQAVHDIAAHLQDEPVEVVMAGTGNATTAQEAASDSVVHWLGGVPPASMPAFCKGVSIGLSTSPKEAFGLAACEMATWGSPIVTRNNGGVPECTGTDLLYDRPAEAAERIMNLVEDDAVYAEKSSRCQETARQYDYIRMANEYDNLFKRLR